MTGLVLGHLVYGVVHGVQVLLLGQTRQTHLVLAGAALGIHTFEQVGLGIPNDVADQFGELRSVLGLLPGIALESLGDFGVTLAIRLTSHRQVLSHLGTFAHKVIVQTFPQLLAGAFAVAELMLRHEIQTTGLLLDLYELLLAYFAHRALIGCLGTFVDISTNGTTPFLSHNSSLYFVRLCVISFAKQR